MARVAMAHKADDETDYTIDPAVYNRVAIKARPTTIPRSCNCMADKCAMWRWGVFMAPPPDAEPGELVAAVCHRAKWGYCGLSGIPMTTEN